SIQNREAILIHIVLCIVSGCRIQGWISSLGHRYITYTLSVPDITISSKKINKCGIRVRGGTILGLYLLLNKTHIFNDTVICCCIAPCILIISPIVWIVRYKKLIPTHHLIPWTFILTPRNVIQYAPSFIDFIRNAV